MSIRQPAAEKLARQLLQLRPPRMEALEPRFFTAMAKVIMAYVDIDEQRQRTEKVMETPSAVPACEGCTTPKGCAHFGCKDQPPPDAAPHASSEEK